MKNLARTLSSLKLFLFTLIMVSALLTMGAPAQAFEWLPANQYTIAWDAVTSKTDGSDLDQTDTVEYSVYLANSVTDPSKTNPSLVGRTDLTQYVVTLNFEGSYFVGVSSHRMLEDGTEAGESVIAWSDDPVATGAGNEFGIRYLLGPSPPRGLRPQPPQ